MKRAFDLTMALLAIMLLWPVMLLLALIIWRCLGAPVLFRQLRPGLHGRPFTLYKFRSMSDKRDASGRLLPDEARLGAVGRTIRKLSLDELPQLFNVLRGDMSLVGPRPLLMEYMSLYSPEQGRRHEVRPGITGWAQVNGRNALSWDERFRLDVWYVDHRSFALDLRILLMTIGKVLGRHGVSEPGRETMTPFTGSQQKGRNGE